MAEGVDMHTLQGPGAREEPCSAARRLGVWPLLLYDLGHVSGPFCASASGPGPDEGRPDELPGHEAAGGPGGAFLRHCAER